MRNGVTIAGKHCMEDLGLYLEGYTISLPEIQTHYVEIPGMDGRLDLTESLDGKVHYYHRSIAMTFGTFEQISKIHWDQMLEQIGHLLHGKKVDIIFDDAPEWVWSGRCTISEFDRDRYGRQTFTLEADCEPYRYPVEPTVYGPVSGQLSRVKTEITLTKHVASGVGNNALKLVWKSSDLLDISDATYLNFKGYQASTIGTSSVTTIMDVYGNTAGIYRSGNTAGSAFTQSITISELEEAGIQTDAIAMVWVRAVKATAEYSLTTESYYDYILTVTGNGQPVDITLSLSSFSTVSENPPRLVINGEKYPFNISGATTLNNVMLEEGDNVVRFCSDSSDKYTDLKLSYRLGVL